MSDLREIKNRINSIQDTQKITNAMYLIASSKLNSSKEKISVLQKYTDIFEKNIKNVLASDKNYCNFLSDKYIYDTCILLGPDKGFCGDYAKNILKSFEKYIDSFNPDNVYVYGKQLIKLFEFNSYKYNKEISGCTITPGHDSTEKLAGLIHDLINNNNSKGIMIIYTEYSNRMPQNVICREILPIICESKNNSCDIELIPDKKTVFNRVIYQYLYTTLFNILFNSYCSEQNSRMIAMDSANKNAKELLDELKIKYNRGRQNSITQEIIEITSNS